LEQLANFKAREKRAILCPFIPLCPWNNQNLRGQYPATIAKASGLYDGGLANFFKSVFEHMKREMDSVQALAEVFGAK
jgi:hypothetical protein